MRIRIGTRGSDLALWQARHIAGCLTDAGHETEIIVLETRGDRITDIPLQQLEGKGFFTKELEDALLEQRVDLAVHSHKDLPGEQPPGLVIAAVPPRAATHERLLIAPAAHAPSEAFLPLARGARVGTSAPRRTQQLLALRPDLELLALRGNVPTRVRKLREGGYDAIVLAAAGLDRLELQLDDLVVHELSIEHIVPAPAQGALAIQVRENDQPLRELCAQLLDDPTTATTIAAERALLQTLGGGCNLPLGVAVDTTSEGWRARAFLGADQPEAGTPARWCHAQGANPQLATKALAEKLMAGETTGQGPLGGLKLALTGTGSAETLARRMETLGAHVLREEVLEIEDLEAPGLASAVARLEPGDALVLTSANAARRLLGLEVPEGVSVAAVGPATAKALEEAGLEPQHVGGQGALALARSLKISAGARVLFPCAQGARGELEEELARRGVTVERLVLYRTRTRAGIELEEDVEIRLYLSPSAVAACLDWERAHPATTLRLALGPSTAAALAEASLPHESCRGSAHEDVLASLLAAWRERLSMTSS